MRRPNASRVKQKDSDSKVTIPCHFGARQRLQHLASGCQLFISKVCHPLFVPQALSSSFFNHTCMCTLCAWGLLWSRVHITHWFVTAGFQCEEHENPADFFLDVITRCENPPSAVLENQGEQLTNTTLLNKLYLTSDLLWLAMHDSMCSTHSSRSRVGCDLVWQEFEPWMRKTIYSASREVFLSYLPIPISS